MSCSPQAVCKHPYTFACVAWLQCTRAEAQVRLQADADPVTLSFYHGDSPSEVAADRVQQCVGAQNQVDVVAVTCDNKF
eukprot:4232966-Amphidinium_carterae.1